MAIIRDAEEAPSLIHTIEVVVRLELELGAGEEDGFGWGWARCEVRGLEGRVAEATGWDRRAVLGMLGNALRRGEVE